MIFVSKPKKLDFVIPEEAADRGPIMLGEMSDQHHRYPALLAQFSKMAPSTRKARLYLLPDVEQARKLYGANGPFAFEASFETLDNVVETRRAKDIWLKPSSQIVNKEATFWSQTSGQIGSLEIKTTYSGPELDARKDEPYGWFVARRCFALQILANADAKDIANAAKYNFPKREDVSFTLTDGVKAEVQRYTKYHRKSGRQRNHWRRVFDHCPRPERRHDHQNGYRRITNFGVLRVARAHAL
jgi:hypothetical protein